MRAHLFSQRPYFAIVGLALDFRHSKPLEAPTRPARIMLLLQAPGSGVSASQPFKIADLLAARQTGIHTLSFGRAIHRPNALRITPPSGSDRQLRMRP